jgi:gamma-glutamylcyclotransferase (GGCT)/AIG2-like uncharacterized protein YtfP
MSELIFVHGSLVHGGHNHHLIGDALFAGRATVKGVAYGFEQNGRVEAAMSVRGGGDSWVPGELYYADDALIGAIDGIQDGSIERKKRQVRAGSDGPVIDAWVWAWSGDWTGDWKDRRVLPGGLLPTDENFPGPTMWYYAFASNMYQMAERRELDCFEMVLGRIDNWRVAFAKDSGDGQHCYVTVLPKRDGVVKGACYRMKNSQLESDLDPQEKEGRHLERKTYEVKLEDGTDRVIYADLYRTMPRWWYWGRISHPVNTEKIVPGAREIGLDDEYCDWLEKFVNEPCDPESYDMDLHKLLP